MAKFSFYFIVANEIDPIQFKDKALQTVDAKLWKLTNVKVYWDDVAVNSGDGSKKIVHIA